MATGSRAAKAHNGSEFFSFAHHTGLAGLKYTIDPIFFQPLLSLVGITTPLVYLVTFNLAFATYAYVDVVCDALMVTAVVGTRNIEEERRPATRRPFG